MIHGKRRTRNFQNVQPPSSKQQSHYLKYKKLIKLKGTILNLEGVKVIPQIFSKKIFIKTMHRKHFDYPSCGKSGIYPIKPLHFETSYRLMISIFLFSPQKLSLLSPSAGYFL